MDVQSKVAVKTRFKGVGWNERMLTKDSPVALLQWAGLRVRNGVLEDDPTREEKIDIHNMYNRLEECEPALTKICTDDDLFHRLARGETVAILASRITKQKYEQGQLAVLHNQVARKLLRIS